MLQKTRGIVLSHTKYRETSLIVRIYTEELGLQGYLINGVRTASARGKMAAFQPLTLLDLVVYYREGGGLHRIKESRPTQHLKTVPYDFVKTGIALFMTEVLSKTLQEEEANPALFIFLFESVRQLDALERGLSLFPIRFLLGLSAYLGFSPQTSEDVFGQLHIGGEDPEFAREEKRWFDALLQGEALAEKAPADIRRALLKHMLQFYQLHAEGFKELKSLAVLQEIMS